MIHNDIVEVPDDASRSRKRTKNCIGVGRPALENIINTLNERGEFDDVGHHGKIQKNGTTMTRSQARDLRRKTHKHTEIKPEERTERVVLKPYGSEGPSAGKSQVDTFAMDYANVKFDNSGDSDSDSEPEIDPNAPFKLYANEIFKNLKEREIRYLPRPDYMGEVQLDITHNMRSILVDWLVEVCLEYKLCEQTFYLAADYIDRMLSVIPVNRSKLQLVGITAMLVAAKYEEIYPPSIDDFVFITDNTYTKEEVIGMETRLLTALHFFLTVPTPLEFLERLVDISGLTKSTVLLAKFLCELVVQEPCYLVFSPSLIACSAICLSLYTNRYADIWPAVLEISSGYRKSDIKICVAEIHKAYWRASQSDKLKAVRDKYATEKYDCVSTIQCPQLLY